MFIRIAAASLLAALTVRASAEPIQWTVQDGGNGHWYEFADISILSWQEAQNYAVGIGGHLVTATSETEQQFVAQLAISAPGQQDCWLGGYQDTSAPDYSEPAGGWRWVTGEPWSYTAWRSGEPNDYLHGESWLAATTVEADELHWVDSGPFNSPGPCHPIIEWDADCNGDGVVDKGQIMVGQLTDANENGVPDACEPPLPQVAWFHRNVAGPSIRYGHAMAYDSARGVTVLFGGYAYPTGYSDETWEWDGTAWSRRFVSGPSARLGHAMAYDSVRGVTVLFGGDGSGDQTWEWNGLVWTQRNVAGPPARYLHAMAYDAARGVTVLFGGHRTSGGGDFEDTWEWNGSAWSQRMVSGPTARNAHAMAYDSARAVTVLFGGSTNNHETWEWNGSAWALIPATGPARYQHAMCFDILRGRTVMFGSDYYIGGDETWEWNGTAWAQLLVSGPLRRNYPAMAYDSARGAVVLFGGYGYGDTWELGVPCETLPTAVSPALQAVCSGDSATFAVNPVGIGGFTYVWRFNSTPISASVNPSAQSARLTIPDVAGSDQGQYDCVISSACGNVVSNVASLAMLPDVTIISQPQPLALIPGTTASFTVVASGAETFQWRRGGNSLSSAGRVSGATTPTLIITGVQNADQGHYDCVVSNGCGTVTSASAELSCAPIILSQPGDFVLLTPGLQLSVSVPANAPYTYRWRQNGQNLFNIPGLYSGVTTRTLTILTTDPSMEGSYDLVVTGACGTATTAPTIVSICDRTDFNGDGLYPDTADLDDFLSVFSGGPCSNDPTCGDIDFNNDGLYPDTADIDALLNVFSGGPCL